MATLQVVALSFLKRTFVSVVVGEFIFKKMKFSKYVQANLSSNFGS